MFTVLASVGLQIAIADIEKEVADNVAAEICKEIRADVIGVEAYMLDKESLERVKAEINDRLGHINVLVNRAGGNSRQARTTFLLSLFAQL
jgi:NAD(P)-dependent dehydrogenase (short-subunit alcohol dehydrogenase family)